MKAVLLFVVSLLTTSSAQAGTTLDYEPMIVSLSGVLTREDFPGPPNYESIKRGDRLERQWILNLKEPVKVVAAPDDELFETHDGVRRVQLVCSGNCWNIFERFKKGKWVTIIGTLFSAQTGHHRTKVLMDVTGESLN